MKVVIIEDEPLTAKDLAACIQAADPDVSVVASLGSIGEANAWFRRNNLPDLIFSDIQLGDGKSFTVFDQLARKVPVIFCTAYDEFALEAFRAAGIDYILKPFTEGTVKEAMNKFHLFRGTPATGAGIEADRSRPAAAGAVLVHYKDRILPVKMADIAMFYLEKELVRLLGFDGKTYLVSRTLEELERLAGPGFYRVNRQYLVNRSAVKDMSQYFGRRLLLHILVPFPGKITVARQKVPVFLEWLSAG
jgi:DNA-binding LytR/AlgR family response regulator